MSIHLSAAYSPSVPMPEARRPRKALVWLAQATGVGALRAALARRARQRDLEAALLRLAETAPHLLDDIGEPTPPAPEPMPFPASARGVPSPFHLLSDAPRRARPPRPLRQGDTWDRPEWSAPTSWLR